ncbi:helix-hairpin-helix domain-containing protein [uncultured Croceitalea sp.]|uniref:ComEA family DNA-binding protein n=1 Tax=uncultured Croceitalea sp. TaxID=1798908 RepID=UPI0033068293
MKSYFRFNKQERSGIFFLLLLIVCLQGLYFFFKTTSFDEDTSTLKLNTEHQVAIDSIRQRNLQEEAITNYSFNPNFISDYKGYTLGMSPEEIDKLHAFRELGKYVNSVERFQEITGVSDSLLKKISPYFKFPNWVKSPATDSSKKKVRTDKNTISKVQDINSVTAEDLRSISGIGDKLSVRIIKFRDRLGGFLVNEQLYDVYGLDKTIADRTMAKFQVLKVPKVPKINLNTASFEELSSLVYFGRRFAAKIVAYRNEHGPFSSFEDLFNITEFSINKIDRIKLYLSL